MDSCIVCHKEVTEEPQNFVALKFRNREDCRLLSKENISDWTLICEECYNTLDLSNKNAEETEAILVKFKDMHEDN